MPRQQVCLCGHRQGRHKDDTGKCRADDAEGKPCPCESFAQLHYMTINTTTGAHECVCGVVFHVTEPA